MHAFIAALLHPLRTVLPGARAGLALWSAATTLTGPSRSPAWVPLAGAVGAMALGLATFLPFMHGPLAAIAPAVAGATGAA